MSDEFLPGQNVGAGALNRLAESARSSHLGYSGFLVSENGSEQVSRNPRRSPAKNDSVLRSDSVVPAIVDAGPAPASWANGIPVILFGAGFVRDSTGAGTVYLPEVGSRTCAKDGMAVLCHPFSSFVFPGDSGAAPEDDEEEEEGEEGQ